MPLQIIVKNSSVSGKEPTGAQLTNGEIALNYHADGPFLTCKDSAGAVRRITGVWVNATSPSTPTPGELWLDTSVTPALLKVYKDGTDNWVAATSATSANTGSTVVARDASGNFSAGTITANLTGNVTGNLTGIASGIANNSVTSAKIVDETIVNSDISASAAIAGTKISPDFGAQNVTTTGTSTAASFIPTSSTAPANGMYLSAANTLAFNTNSGAGRLFIDASGNVGVAQAASSTSRLAVLASAVNFTDASITSSSSGAYGHSFRVGNDFASYFSKDNNGEFRIGRSSSSIGGGSISGLANGGLALTTSTDNSSYSERLRITSTGTVNIVGAGTAGSTQAVSFNGSAPAGSMVLDDSGRLLVGTSTARNTFPSPTGSSHATGYQIESNTVGIASQSIVYNANNTSGGGLIFAKSRGTTNGSFTAVAENDTVGFISFQGAEGSAMRQAATITAAIDGAVTGAGAADMPGRLVFSTTPDGSATPTERLRITSTGQVRLAGAGITFNGDTATANELDDYEEGTWTPAFSFSTSGSVTYSSQLGEYVKVGNTVVARGQIILSAVSSPAGNATITGLPFTSGNRNGNNGSGLIGIARNFASAGLPLAIYNVGNSASVIITKNSTNAGVTQLQGSDLTATTAFYFTVIYAV